MLQGRAARVAWATIRGVVSGFLYYVVYVIGLPVLASALGTPQAGLPEELSSGFLPYLAVLIGLGIGAAAARGTPVALPLNLFSSIVGWLIAYHLLDGGMLQGSAGGYTVTVDIRPLLYAVLALGLLYSTASGLESMASQD